MVDFVFAFPLIISLFVLFVSFVLRHINLIGHLMPNKVKENKSEKKFKGEILRINDKLIISLEKLIISLDFSLL